MSGGVNQNAWAAAIQAGAALGIDPGLLYGQFAGETGNFTNSGAANYNYGGIQATGGGQAAYTSPSSFASAFTSLIQKRYPNAVGAGSNVNQYVAGLTGPIGTYYAGPNNTGQQETAAMYAQMITSNEPAANYLSQLTANATGRATGGATPNPGGTMTDPTGSGNVITAAQAKVRAKVTAGQAKVAAYASKYGVIVVGVLLILFAVILSQRSGSPIQITSPLK